MALQPLDGAPEAQVHPLGIGLAERGGDLGIEAAQQRLSAVEQGRLGAERGEDARELDRDVAAADHEDARRLGLQIEHAVRVDGEFRAGDQRLVDRARPHRDQDEFCAHAPVRADEADRVRVLDDGAFRHDLDAGAREVAAVDALQPGDLGIARGLERRPVEARRIEVPAEARGIGELVGEAPGIDHQLLGHAAADHAGAADAVLLRQHHPGAVAGGDPRRPHAAGATADHEQVDVEAVAHGILTRSVQAWPYRPRAAMSGRRPAPRSTKPAMPRARRT